MKNLESKVLEIIELEGCNDIVNISLRTLMDDVKKFSNSEVVHEEEDGIAVLEKLTLNKIAGISVQIKTLWVFCEKGTKFSFPLEDLS